jgi:tetratricopeptide (TPR) repeat protein
LKLEQQAVALDDSLAGAHSILGDVYALSGQYDRGLAEVQRGIALDPNSATGYLFLAEVLNQLGKATDALTAIEKGIRLDPRNNVNYLNQQGWSYRLLGRSEEAISSLKTYTARYPEALPGRVNLAKAYVGLGDMEAAQAEVAGVQQLVALEPDSASGLWNLADAMNGTGRPVEALAVVKEAMRLHPSLAHRFMGVQGWAYSQLGRWDEAIPLVKRSPVISTHPWPHVWLAVITSSSDATMPQGPRSPKC